MSDTPLLLNHVAAVGKSVRLLRSKMPVDLLRGMACMMVLFYHGFAAHCNSEGLSRMARLSKHVTDYGWAGVN